jgi:hypothetical protein
MTEKEYLHNVSVTDKGKKEMDRAAALLNLENWCQALSLGLNLVRDHAEAHVKGRTEVFFCTSELKACVESNPAFFEALCQEGVVEWLMPFVLGKNVSLSQQNQ